MNMSCVISSPPAIRKCQAGTGTRPRGLQDHPGRSSDILFKEQYPLYRDSVQEKIKRFSRGFTQCICILTGTDRADIHDRGQFNRQATDDTQL